MVPRICLYKRNPYSRSDIFLQAHVNVNSVKKLAFAQSENGNSLSMNNIVHLDLYESVNVWIYSGQTKPHSDANYFQIQKIV